MRSRRRGLVRSGGLGSETGPACPPRVPDPGAQGRDRGAHLEAGTTMAGPGVAQARCRPSPRGAGGAEGEGGARASPRCTEYRAGPITFDGSEVSGAGVLRIEPPTRVIRVRPGDRRCHRRAALVALHSMPWTAWGASHLRSNPGPRDLAAARRPLQMRLRHRPCRSRVAAPWKALRCTPLYCPP